MRFHSIFAMIFGAVAWANGVAAELPRKAELSRYAGLWANSPFTSRPPPAAPGETVNPLDDFALLGVSPINGGYRVTLFDKKKPTERIVVDSDNPKSEFKILSVSRKPGEPLGTTVNLSSGTMTGTVAYDETSLAITPRGPVPPSSPQGPVVIPPPPQPGMPIDPNAAAQQRQPRPRVVPPPVQTPQPGNLPGYQVPVPATPRPQQFLPDGTPMREPNPPPGGPFPRRQGAAGPAAIPPQGQPPQPAKPRTSRRPS